MFSRIPTTPSQATSRAVNNGPQAPHTRRQTPPPLPGPRLRTSVTWPHPGTGVDFDLENGLGADFHPHGITPDTASVANQRSASYLGDVGRAQPSELPSIAGLVLWILHITAALGLPLVAGLSEPLIPLIIL